MMVRAELNCPICNHDHEGKTCGFLYRASTGSGPMLVQGSCRCTFYESRNHLLLSGWLPPDEMPHPEAP